MSGKALGGRASGVYELRFVKSNMLLAGYAGAGIQYLGGLSVLTSFDDGDLAKKLLSEKEVWSRWFFLESNGDLSFDRLGILLDIGNRINGVLSLSWQDKRYKVWVVEENDQWIPDFLEDDEISVAASSELGGDSAIPVDDTPASKEDEELAKDDVAEVIEKRKDNQGSPGDMHVPMQRKNFGGGFVTNDKVGRLSINVGQDFSNSHNCLNNSQEGNVERGPPLVFNVGRSTSFKSTKVKSTHSKKVRPNVSFGGVVFDNMENRPKKRSRTFMEGNGNSGRQVRSEGTEGVGSDNGFE
ncbi:hypothetical protein HanXRQr2_Chr05g0223071 [Helianthus annuus]|uniref:Nucleotide-binding alpha-beta plait domain-containing protein n=1 Tax=Helianthus annuus TaxID=4232 RepID=A0A9K3J0K9_HELAN|nr:hypothetical protein HanXRQr2_Chr05g0223071 [Helianthus annuus]KAJ0585172.1 hypothetical protein HanHA89_Chr05g0197241 [Helianthus annuus]